MKVFLPVLDVIVDYPVKDIGMIVEDAPISSSNPTGWIIAIVAGVAIVAGLTIYFITKNKKQNNQNQESEV